MKVKGYIIELTEQSILVATNITEEQFNEVKDMSSSEILTQNLRLISIRLSDTASFRKGDKVEVSIDGEIAESYPEQAKAKKIKLIKGK
ncbi:DUF3221 domain-containing protein [Bacillus sp. PS06]|uniref:DUF3221 domain-containing protein n=1 Tax=Bacillus sp. PS06 TaxID=2764176 RepID=UPI001786D6D2|nr:DUF3221 domain-containing protein [Bacillus sp. PS06]MBD8067801.1 DUF3221 domain-containing protein [Bacillus sp. PS06]